MQDVSTKFSTKGTVIANRYIIDELLGTGGFGAVYRVQDRRVRGNVFALKEVANPNTHERQSFLSECTILKRLDHEALPHVYRVFEDHEHHRVYMLMDYIDGPNLEQLRQQQPRKRLPFSRVMKIMAPIISAIIYLHAQQPPIIHRDIKPANIIVPPNDDGTVLVDFGIAKEYEPDSTTTAIRHCSPGYGSPEHYATGTDIRTDIYSLGATFYALLTGVVPTDALYRMAQMSSKGIDPLLKVNALLPTLSGELAEILARAMAINSADRFASVEEFWQALQGCQIADEPVEDEDQISSEQTVETTSMLPATTSPDGASGKLPQSAGRQKWLIAGLCSLVLVALLSGVVWGTGLLPWGQQNSNAVLARTATSTAIGAVRSPVITATSTQQPVVTTTPTATAIPTPTVQPAVSPSPTAASEYPVLTGRYDGTISNKFTTPSTDTSMSLSQMQQDGAAIRGYFSVGSGLVGDGNFTGIVTTDNKIQFLVPGYGGLLPLFFSGQIQQDGSISGSYCSYQNNQCNFAAGGHGAWHVNPS